MNRSWIVAMHWTRISCVSLLALALWQGVASAQMWELSGLVVDPDGNGIAGVDIDIASSDGTDLSLSGDFTDANGAFSLTVLDTVLAGFYSVQVNPAAGAGVFPLAVNDIFIAGSADLGTFELAFGATISGRVVDESGAGIAGIDLEFADANGVDYAANNDDTDPLGFYSVMIPHGTWDIEFRQVLPELVNYVSEIIEGAVVTGDLALADVTMVVGYSLTGHVENSSGTALLGADVDVEFALTGEKVHTTNDNTDAAGNFEVIVPPGDLAVIVRPPSGQLLVPAVVPFTMQVPPPANDVGTVVLAPGVTVSATIVDDGLVPVVDVDADFVTAGRQTLIPTVSDNSNALGVLSVVVPADTYDIQLRPPFTSGAAPVVLAGIDATTSTDLGSVVLPAGNALTGTVTDGATPVAGVLVTLSDAATGVPIYVFGNVTSAAGEYALRVVDGTYDVQFTPPVGSGLGVLEVPSVAVNSATDLDVDLGAGGGVSEFVRGNANGDASVGLADVIYTLFGLFANGPLPACRDIIDINDDGITDISDPIYLLNYLFVDGPDIPAPFPTSGVDATADSLACP